jgi:hypothetical protein
MLSIMARIILLLLISLFLSQPIKAQDKQLYSQLVAEASTLYNNKKYAESGKKYNEAFRAWGNKGQIDDRYNAACSWALANEADSAFVQLFKIATSGKYTDLNHITTDSDLNSLHADKRWDEVIAMVRASKEKVEVNLNKPLATILDSVFYYDQNYRQQIGAIEKKYGKDSPELKTHFRLILEKDSINLLIVKKVLDEHGWLGADSIGEKGNTALFLVIQHADIQTQEKYLPMMREAVKKGNANPSSLALLEDRVALRQGKKQIYGSQIGLDLSYNKLTSISSSVTYLNNLRMLDVSYNQISSMPGFISSMPNLTVIRKHGNPMN